MTHSFNAKRSVPSSNLEKDVKQIYQMITSSRYVTNRHLEQIVIDAKLKIEQTNSKQPWSLFLLYLQGVYDRSVTENVQEFERRFYYFFQAMSSSLNDLFPLLPEDEKKQYVHELLQLVVKDAHKENAPWTTILSHLSRHLSAAQVEQVYTFLSKSIDSSICSRSLILVFSYIALLAEKEVTSLAILLKSNDPFNERELSAHFQLLKKRMRWHTMKHWVHRIFPQRQGELLGSLQPYIDEMNTALSSSPAEQKAIWERWLHSPNYDRFLTYTRHFSLSEKKKLACRLLEKLEQQLDHYETAKTYEKLLLAFEQYDLAMRYFLKYEREPHRLRPEKKELLLALKTNRPELAKPIYHQFIIRLIERKSRHHYEEAAHYLKALQSIYETMDESELFNEYLMKLKNMYRTYRAFIEELKQIDL